MALSDLGVGDNAVERFTRLSTALNSAVDKARQKRQDSTLDYLKGTIPKGALSAGSFSSVVNAFNQSAAPVASTFAQGALDFAQIEEQRKQKNISDIRNLGVSLIENGAKSEDVKTILRFTENGDINGAMTAAAGILSNLPKSKDFSYFNTDDGIVQLDKSTGETKVVFGGGTTPGTSSTGGDESTLGGKDSVFVDNSGNEFNLGTSSGIAKFKAEHPEFSRSDIKAFLDEQTGLTTGSIDSLLEEGGFPKDEKSGASTIEDVKSTIKSVAASLKDKRFEKDEAKEAIEFKLTDGGKRNIPKAWQDIIDEELDRLYQDRDIPFVPFF